MTLSCTRGVKRLYAAFAALALASGLMAAGAAPAEARHRYHRHYGHANIHVRHYVHIRRYGYRHAYRHGYVARAAAAESRAGYLRPTYSSIIVDANTGRTLDATNENAPHHPASVTKVMTLYLLFEQMEKGRIALDDEIPVSAHAASMSPSKLGLRPGSTIEVEDAIKAIVTKSANDIAVAVAEKVGGDEDSFAEMMTRKARSLGMNGTTYRNASGLPNPQQITTARDLAILGRAIQDRFPKYYRYFSTHTFYFAGRPIRNHNHLLGAVEGVDGIKTGYTAASGFNLLTSVRRNGRHIVGVVLGGRSGGQRDRIMAGLIESNLPDASARRTAVAMTESEDEAPRPAPRVAEALAVRETPAQVVRTEPRPEPRQAERQTERQAERQVASLDLSVPVPPGRVEAAKPEKGELRVEKARPAFVSATQRSEPASEEPSARSNRRASTDGSTTRTLAYASATTTATPSPLRWVAGPAGRSKEKVATAAAPRAAAEKTVVAKSDPKSSERAADKLAAARPVRPGWMIQIGATDDAGKANDLIARARAKASLGSAQAFTEKVQKGSETLWRARFAGLEENSAEAACRTLKRSGFACFTTRN